MRYRELTVRERAMLVGWWLAKEGENITSAQLARKLGCHRVTAWRPLPLPPQTEVADGPAHTRRRQQIARLSLQRIKAITRKTSST